MGSPQVRCVDRSQPDFGFGEIGTYLTYVLTHHADAHMVATRKSWSRGPLPGLFNLMQTDDGFCCGFDSAAVMRYHSTDEYVGTELGHPDTQQQRNCHYSEDEYFLTHPYPPAHHTFWREHNVRFSLQLRANHAEQHASVLVPVEV